MPRHCVERPLALQPTARGVFYHATLQLAKVNRVECAWRVVNSSLVLRRAYLASAECGPGCFPYHYWTVLVVGSCRSIAADREPVESVHCYDCHRQVHQLLVA